MVAWQPGRLPQGARRLHRSSSGDEYRGTSFAEVVDPDGIVFYSVSVTNERRAGDRHASLGPPVC